MALKEDSGSLTLWGIPPLCMASVRARRCTLDLYDSKNFMSMLVSAFAFSKGLLRLFDGGFGDRRGSRRVYRTLWMVV